MELKEYLEIFRKNIKTFFVTLGVVLLLGIGYYASMPDNFKTHLNLNVTRAGKSLLGGYEYDEFYRLQADERFADTVVRWLDSGRFRSDIATDSKIGEDLKMKSKRLSSQMIEITYVTASENQSFKVAGSVSRIVNDKARELNKDQGVPSWFKVMADEPYLEKNKMSFWKMLSIFASLGAFLGVWAVFLKHYFKK